MLRINQNSKLVIKFEFDAKLIPFIVATKFILLKICSLWHRYQLASGTANVVKEIGQWPDDLNAGSNSRFLYCDLVKSETLDDTQTALLRSIPLKCMTLAHTMGEVNHKGSQIYSGSGSSNPNSGPSV